MREVGESGEWRMPSGKGCVCSRLSQGSCCAEKPVVLASAQSKVAPGNGLQAMDLELSFGRKKVR